MVCCVFLSVEPTVFSWFDDIPMISANEREEKIKNSFSFWSIPIKGNFRGLKNRCLAKCKLNDIKIILSQREMSTRVNYFNFPAHTFWVAEKLFFALFFSQANVLFLLFTKISSQIRFCANQVYKICYPITEVVTWILTKQNSMYRETLAKTKKKWCSRQKKIQGKTTLGKQAVRNVQ